MSGSIVVTGAGRGLGAALVKNYSAAGWAVWVGVRGPEARQRLSPLRGVTPVLLDVARPADVAALSDTLDGASIDILVNNAAIFDSDGSAVVLTLLQHARGAGNLVGRNRVYVTSPWIARSLVGPVERALALAGSALGLRDMAAVAEVRIDGDDIRLIEINPLRLDAWGAVDIARWAYGFDPYDHLITRTRPRWDLVTSEREDLLHVLVFADLPQDVRVEDIQTIDHAALRRRYGRLLEWRPVDYRRWRYLAVGFHEVTTAEWPAILARLDVGFRDHIITRAESEASS